MKKATVILFLFILAASSSKVLALQDSLYNKYQTSSQELGEVVPVAEDTGITMPPMKGMTVNAWSGEAYNSTDFDESITNLAGIKANWVTFTVFWFMNASTGTTIQPRPDLYTASDTSLIHAIQKAHELDMHVALKPMVDVADGSWRGTIAPTSWSIWFVNYRDFINHYAALGETHSVELFEVGTELRSSQSSESEWRQVITEVRSQFSGTLTYAANWDSYSTYSRLPQYAVRFWDALDYVGVDAYFPLTNSYSPTVTQLINAWSYSTASGWWGTGLNWTSELHSTHTQTGKNIIFTEIGYYSQDGTNTQPWTGFSPSHQIDLQEQADCYRAAIEAFRNETWFSGWFWWDWDTNPEAGGPTDNWYTPQDKPAQSVLNQYYDNEVPPDLAVMEVTTSKTVVGSGYPVTVNITVENQGMYPETFNLTTYINSALIQRITLTLENGNSTINAIVWDTTGFASGNYTILSQIDALPSEIHTLNNAKYADEEVCVTIPGDVNADHDVDIFDIVRIAGVYGVSVSDPLYKPNMDIDGDGDIDIFDIVVAAGNYGETEPAPATANLAPADSNLTSPTGDYRWLDSADQSYATDYRNSYNYSQATATVTYFRAGETLTGRLVACNLKPNFAYQLKLAGEPGSTSNEQVGLAGRWWQEEWNGSEWSNGQNLNNKGDGSSPNPNDLVYFARRFIEDLSSPTGYYYRYTGYLLFTYFITDENGDASIYFETGSCYHVLWKTSQRSPTSNDGPVQTAAFNPDPSHPAYDVDYPNSTVSIFGEWERLPMGEVNLFPGQYNCQITLTEESFHSTAPLAGNWAAAMNTEVSFEVTG